MVKPNLKEEDLPTVLEVLQKLMRRGTLLMYPEKPIFFPNTLQSVKSLSVNICSSETIDMAILHKLHTKTKII